MANDVFIISDTHFSHGNFLKFINEAGELIRPFSCVEEMDELMIDRWNTQVTPKDKVYHLGDVCFNLTAFNRIMPRLNGRKVLVFGNHDKFQMGAYEKHFKSIYSWRIIDTTPQLVLCHYPLHPSCVGKRHNIHGHTHERLIKMENGTLDPRYTNVCVEQVDYTPVPLEWAEETAKRKDALYKEIIHVKFSTTLIDHYGGGKIL